MAQLNKKYYISLGNHDSNSTNGFTKKDTLEYLKQTNKTIDTMTEKTYQYYNQEDK